MRSLKLLLALIVVANMFPLMALAKVTLDHPPAETPSCRRAPSPAAQLALCDEEGALTRGTLGALYLGLLCVSGTAFFAHVFNARLRDSVSLPPAASGSGTSPATLDYLREATREAGGFLIVAHAAEDLGLSAEQLEAALAAARAEDPTLELRVVAERRVLRRPRL
ncbi:MAG TPA: hypothetical protein DEA08_16735 [Planctomycetes bacterium]|nr:hypothetical protein [Planctomycetota bacterium]